MRQAYNNVKVIIEDDVFLGISLGYDYAAEHEWGIEDMRRRLGIDETKMGVEGRRITNPDRIALLEDDNTTLITSRPNSDNTLTSSLWVFRGCDLNEKEVFTAWNSEAFAVASNKAEVREYIRQLFAAAKKNDVIIGFVKENSAFKGTSMCLLIESALTQDIRDTFYNVDKSAFDLIEYEKEIGLTDLKEVAKSAGYKGEHYFMACSPKWIDYDDAENREDVKKRWDTQYNILYWVNYSDDDDNYGWYCVEEIKQWLSTPGLKLKQIRYAKEVKRG